MSSLTLVSGKPSHELPPSEALPRLANRIMAYVKKETDGVGLFPSERDLASHLKVSRHAVRVAIDYLQERGVIVRVPGRGTVCVNSPALPASTTPALRCINFLQGPAHQITSMQWLVHEYLAGYTEVLELHDVKTRFVYWEDGRTDFESIFWSQAPRTQQACVLLNRRAPALLKWLNAQRVPYVVQNHAAYDDAKLPPHHRVYVNKMGAAFDATKRLLELGHRRIGFVGQLPSKSALWPEYEGFAAAMRYMGLAIDPADCVQLVTEELPVAIGPCRDLLAKKNHPTAVLGAHGAATMGLKTAAEQLHLKVPGKLSIVGFNSPLTGNCADMSIIEVPRRELAKTVVQTVLQLANAQAQRPPLSCVLNCKILWRGSTSVAPSSSSK